MASNWSNCAVCDQRQVTKPAVVWCSECDEGLCGDCNEHHSISKASRNHETVSIAEYQKLPKEILQVVTVCKIHNEKYELFCKKHDCPCCKKCVNSHNDCKGLTDISNELIKNVKTSNAFYEIEQTLLEVAENIKLIKTNREENLTSLEKQKREIEEEIKQTRTKINHHLDELQDELLNELKAAEQKENSKIQKLLTDLKTKEREITEFKENIANIKQHTSELQAFLAIRHFEKEISDDEKLIQSIIKSDATNQANITCQFTKSLAQITASVQKFGEINVSSDPCSLSIKNWKQNQAQIVVALPTTNIDDLTLTLQKRINTELIDIRGCTMLPDGRIVFSKSGGDIRVLKSEGSLVFEMNKIGSTLDVVFIGDDSIAVTSSSSTKIYVIDTKKEKIKRTVKVNSTNDGVVYKDGHLIYCSREKGLQMISLNDESITNVTNTKLSDLAYVTTFGDKLFFTNRKVNHSVTCCDYHGNILWTFCEKRVLASPLGISVDNSGNVFVVGCQSNNVVVISPDGQRYRQLLSYKDGLDRPQVLHYDTSTHKLLVANRNETAFMYDVK